MNKSELYRQLCFKKIPLAFTTFAVGPINEPPISDVNKKRNFKIRIIKLSFLTSFNYVSLYSSFSFM